MITQFELINEEMVTMQYAIFMSTIKLLSSDGLDSVIHIIIERYFPDFSVSYSMITNHTDLILVAVCTCI